MHSAGIRRIRNKLGDFLYPNTCIGCGEVIGIGEQLCDLCRARLERINPDKLCSVCGNEKSYCSCKKRAFHFERSVAVFEYNKVAQNILLSYKLLRLEQNSEFLIEQMSIAARREFRDVEFAAVCSVPTGIFSRMRRGFDHTEILGEGVAARLNIPVLKGVLGSRALYRSQHKSSAARRAENVKNKYFFKRRINGGSYLLIDDVKTTGATLDECARQLLMAGAEKVYALTPFASVYKKNT